MAKRSYTSKKQGGDASLKVEFELDGVQFTGDGSISLLDLSEFARLASQGVTSDDPAGVAILADIYVSLLGEKEYQRFRSHCRRHGTDAEVLIAIIGDLAGEASGRPTSRSSDSSDGPPTGQDTQTVVSFSRGTVETKPVEETPPLVSYG